MSSFWRVILVCDNSIPSGYLIHFRWHRSILLGVDLELDVLNVVTQWDYWASEWGVKKGQWDSDNTPTDRHAATSFSLLLLPAVNNRLGASSAFSVWNSTSPAEWSSVAPIIHAQTEGLDWVGSLLLRPHPRTIEHFCPEHSELCLELMKVGPLFSYSSSSPSVIGYMYWHIFSVFSPTWLLQNERHWRHRSWWCSVRRIWERRIGRQHMLTYMIDVRLDGFLCKRVIDWGEGTIDMRLRHKSSRQFQGQFQHWLCSKFFLH